MTYEEFKKSALNKKDENEGYLDFKNKVLGKNDTETNTDPLKTLMNATSTYSIGNDGNLVKTPTMEESKNNSKKKTALELLQETQNIGAGDTTYIPPDATEKYALKDIEEKEAKVAKKYDAITPVANYIAGDLATDIYEASAEYSNNPTELNKEKLERAEKLYNDYVANAKNVGKGGWITKDFATWLPQGVEQLKAGLTGGVIAGGATSAVGSVVPVVGNTIGFAGGFKAGYVGGVTKYSYDQMQGAMYKALIDLGREYNVEITHDMALEISKDTAFLQALVEGAETAIDLTSMGVSKLFKKGGTETVKAMTRKQIIAKALKAYGINLVTETLEEGTQEKIAIEGEKKALEQVGINNPYTKEQENERIKEAGYGGFKISAISGLGNVGGSVITSYINNNNVTEINKAYDTAISEINANDKLTTEQKQTQIATLTNERIQVLQKVKGEISQNAENRTQISEENAENSRETTLADKVSKRLGFENQADFQKKYAESQKQTIDSKGRTLTVEQQTHFKDSKMRDENGNLKVMYHGTSADFNEFDITKAKSSGTLGKGFYFTDSVSHAGQYGKQLEVYLNIKNPVQGDYTITEPQLKKFVEAVAENEDYGIENYGYDATVDSVVQSLKGKNDFEILRDINASSIGDFVEAVKFFNEVNGTNYDGIITNTETVVFDSSQVKRVDNTKPTNSKDMRYDSIPTKKKVDTKKEKDKAIAKKEVSLYNQDGGVENGKIQRGGVHESTNESNGLYKKREQEQIEKYTREQYSKFEQSIKAISEEKLTSEEKELIKKYKDEYNKEIIIFDGDENDYGGGASLIDGSKIYINRKTAKEFGFKRIATHEVLESDILHNENIKKIIMPAINSIMQDSNFQKQKLEFWDGQDGPIPTNYLIAKDIICDKFAELENGEPTDYKNVLSQETNKIIEDTIKRYKNLKNSEKGSNFLSKNEERYDAMPTTATDNKGRKLSKGQQEYFKDSKARDEEGNLVTVYHGSNTYGFTVFDSAKVNGNYKFGDKNIAFFTSSKDVANTYLSGEETSGVYKGYLNLKNPLIIDAKGSTWNSIDYFGDGSLYLSTNEIVKDAINGGEANSNGNFIPYDGVIFKNLVDLAGNISDDVKNKASTLGILAYMGKKASPYMSDVYVAFNSNQFKNIDNLNPTDSDDIRYDMMPTMKDGFYSQLENVIINKMQKQAKASDIMNLIQKNGVKQDEIAWTGVDDFLASKDTVTKEELLQYIRASQLEVEEIIKDDYEKERYEQREAEIRERRQEIEEDIYSILEKYEVYMRYGNSTDVIWDFLNTHDESEIYDLVDLENFDNREENKYYYDAESNGYFTLEEMHNDIDRALELYYEYDNLEQELEEIPETAYGYADDFASSTQYKQYATDWSGGEHYREILYKVPYNTYMKALTPYDSPHWNERNVMAHVRLQDYEDDGGAKVLFIEEIQSDMHQEGRKYGYTRKIENYDKKINDLKDEAQHLEDVLVIEQRKEQRRLSRRLEEMRYQEEQIIAKHFIRWREYNDEIVIPLEKRTEPESHSVGVSKTVAIDTKYLSDEDIQTTRESMGLSQEELERLIFLHNKQFEDSKKYKNTLLEIEEIEKNSEELQELYKQIESLQEEKRNNRKKVDSKFPFKTKWHEFVIRKAINEAVQNGYDKVAWTTGEQQAERYDLSKQIDEIKYYQHDAGTFFVNVFKNGRSIQSFEHQTADDLENLLGKSIAEKMLKKEGEVEVVESRFTDASREWHSLSGLDLQVGGEGMKGFYDKIIPDYVNKYIKKWNSKVEEVLIPDYGGKVHVQQGFVITPEMRKSVQEIGQPLYDKEPSVDTMSRKNIIDKFKTTLGVENFANSNKELNSIASDIRNKIKSQKITTSDIKNIVEELGERLQITTDKYNGEFDDLKDELKKTKIYVSENAKKGFAHWNDFRKNNFGTLRLTNDTKSIKISELYEDLQQRYGTDMFPDDIINESDQLEQIAEIAQDLKKENIGVAEYSTKMYGKKGWQEIQQMLIDEIKAIRDEYDLENPIDTSKRARVASKETKEILNALNISDEEIYDPANAFVQNILESMEKDKEYFSRTLKEIEEENLMYGNKRVNTILNKRRFDVQNGRVKANPKYTEGASLSAIRKTIEAHTGKKIGLNGFRQRAYGIYKPTLDTIRVKDISNVETAIHELGHRINYVELNQTLKGASRTELNKLAERAFGPMYDKKPDVKLEEGWAEFTKRFICDNESTIKEYPQLSAYMVEQLEGNKNMKTVVEKLIELCEQYVNAPTEKQIEKMQSVGQDTDSSEKRTFFGEYMYQVHDDLYDLKRMMKAFAKAMKVRYWDITPELNIYNLVRIARSNEDRIMNVMKHGLIDDQGHRRTVGLGDLFELLGNIPEKIQQVRNLLIAMRTLDYTAVGLDTGMSTAEAMKLIKKYSQDKTIMRVANGVITFQDEIMKYAVEKGLMTQEQYEEMKKWNRFYIPLKRVFEGKVNSSSGGTGASKLTKRRTGSMRDIIDPFEAIIQNTSMILDKINQNEIMRTLALLQEKTGIADFYEKIDPPQKLKAEVELNLFKNLLEEQGVDTDEIDLDVVQKIFAPMMNDESKMIMGYMEKGKLQALEFKDKFVYEVISQTGGSADLGVFLEKALSTSQMLRFGATSGNVEFAIPNMISDTMTAWMFSESGFIPMVDTLKGLVDYSLANYSWADKITVDNKYKQQNKFLYDLYKQSGATMATRVSSYRPEIQEYVLEIFGKHANDLLSNDVEKQKNAGKTIMKKLSKVLGKTQDILSILPELSEQATRFEHFKKDYMYAREQGHNHKNALLKATINTRDITMDFNRMGHSMRVYNRIRAFSGARSQGIYRFIEAVNKMPKKVLGKLGILAGIALALKAGAGASDNKKEEEITDQVRKDNFIIPLGKDGEVVTIKKPQGLARSFINFAELLYDVGIGIVDEKEQAEAWERWVKDTIEENAPLELDLKDDENAMDVLVSVGTSLIPIPTASEPILENRLNKDFYYGNPIIPYGKEGLRPEEQYDENTSQTAILLGKVLKQSPAKIENLITGWFAGVGSQTLDVTDTLLGKVSRDIPDQPSNQLSEKFILKRFFANSFKNSDSVSEVYELIEKIEQLEEYEEASESELETLEKLNSAKKTMSDLNKEIKKTRNSLTLTADQKRDRIKELQILRTDVARNALGKELINPASKEQVELYQYYPSKTTFKYEVHANKTVEVEYTEDDMREYARIVKDTYETALAKEQMKRTYKEMTSEEQKKKRNSLLTSAKSTAQEKVSREVYRRSR